MTDSPKSFWDWFGQFVDRIPAGELPDALQDELLARLHQYDDRLYFLIATEKSPCELIITADGNADAFRAADQLVDASPELAGWKIVSLKPAMGFEFSHSDGPIWIDVSKLWFLPTKSSTDPSGLGVVIGLPDADFVLHNQSIDTAHTILESAIGERVCATEIAHVAVDDLPENPDDHGFLQLPMLPEYIEFHKRRHGKEKGPSGITPRVSD